ncbi:hypothetical protein BESB_082710 [Besnoitia besnoiti]|uniref:Transmembrane protein n=1 Tax=Besnoitia besnoiti TaxID=94643 RepID=A0A2A9MCF9_BESBE|nr:hypothetical protein BESB_082710 [Besnoitia besnoiti]PFH33072.1 hypothetical protein BESB_082710 [Besnoitia besnoiti]
MALAVVAVFLSWTSWPDISAAVTSFNAAQTRCPSGVEPQSSLHGKSSGSLPLCTPPFYSCVPLASAGSEEDLSPSTSSNPLSSSSDNETSSCAARGAQETKYVAAYPFRNHVLFDESVFARMNQLRHLIHKMECSPNKDISPEQIEDKFLPLLCEGDLLERTLELARTNYRQQAANASAGDTARLSSLLGQNKPSETDTSGPDRDEAEWRGTSSLLARNAVEGSVGNAHVQPSSARSNNDAQGSRIDELNGGTSALGGALTTSGPLTSLQRLEHLAPQLLAVARYHRRRQAKRKVERLLAAMLTGDVARIDALFLQMAEQKLLDSHLLNLIDELIHEAHMKYSSYKAKEALSETALKTLKRRILAHLEMMKTNRQDFVRILSLCFQTQTEKRRAILKASLYTVDDLERFQEWLEDGIKFAEDTGKLKEDQVKVMKNLVEDCKRANPLNTAPLDRWDEDNAFQADLNLQAAWETSVATCCGDYLPLRLKLLYKVVKQVDVGPPTFLPARWRHGFSLTDLACLIQNL